MSDYIYELLNPIADEKEIVRLFYLHKLNREQKNIYSEMALKEAGKRLLAILEKMSTEEILDVIEEHKDEIEALRIIYNNQGEPLTYSMLKELEMKLRYVNSKFNPSLLWNTYSIVKPEYVTKFSTKEEKEALTNLIQLVRFAYNQIPRLESLYPTANKFFNLWCGQTWRNITDTQKNILKQIINYIVSNGTCTIKDIREWDRTCAAQIIQAFDSNAEVVNESLASLSQFLIYRKAS